MKAEHLESYTYVGTETGVLVVTHGHVTLGNSHSDDQYKYEAHKIVRWLISMFCNRTLGQISEQLEAFRTKSP